MRTMQPSKDTTQPDDTADKQAQPRPRRVIRRRRRHGGNVEPSVVDPVLLRKVLDESNLPGAYSFEIPKTVARINSLQATHVALQMPEGLLMYATVLADILKRLVVVASSTEGTRASTADGSSNNNNNSSCSSTAKNKVLQVSILGDVTYGACCIDDLGAAALGAELLVHYGHSCLVPLQHTVVPCLYVFVEIQMDVPHMVACLDMTIKSSSSSSSSPNASNEEKVGEEEEKASSSYDTTTTNKPHIYLLGTVQFRHAFAIAVQALHEAGYKHVTIPQAKPLSPGEVLGCTSPQLTQHDSSKNGKAVVCFVADGRFHLEATLISNPHIDAFYRYDPYSKMLTEEVYQHEKMKNIRAQAIQQATRAQTFGILLGTLGRQGNPAIVQRIQQVLKQHGKKYFLMLLSEITPAKLQLFEDNDDQTTTTTNRIDAWVQVACPRLSVDWGHFLSTKPVLTPYELFVCLKETEWRDVYPMDYYSTAGGPWANYYDDNKNRRLCCKTKAEGTGCGG